MTIAPTYQPGDEVRIDSRAVSGHCRTPYYLRGKLGVVEAVLGRFRNPELLAYHKPGVPMKFLYRIRFRQSDIWPDYPGSSGDELKADIFEHWLTATVDTA